MANPDLGLGLGATAPAGSARGGLNPSTAPSRRAPRLAKRRHSAASSRSRSPLAPAPPGNPFGPVSGGCTDGLEKGATAAKDVPAGNSKLGGGDGDGVGNFGMGKGQSAGFAFCSLESAEGLSSEHATSFLTPFVFGSETNSLPRFEHGLSSLKLPDKMRKLNLRNSHKGGDVGKKLEQKDEAGKDGRTPFGVDVSSLVRDSEANVHPEKMTQLNIGNVAPLGGVGSGGANHAPEVFAFGSNTASACVNTRNDATSGVNASAPGSIHGTEANALLEKMTQLNIGNEAPLRGIGGEDANCASEVFVFGSNTTSGPVNSRNASGAKAYASNSVRDTVANVSAEKMTQLNIGNGTPSQGTGSEGANHGPEVLVFGSNTASGCIDSGNNAAYDANASACESVHGTEANVLPEKMAQLNKVGATPLQGMKSENANCMPETFEFGRNGTTGFISGQAASRVVDNASDFVSGAKAKAFTSAHVTEVNILAEKMTELHIGRGMLSHSLESETTNQPPEVFVFGSGETTSFFSGQTASTPPTSFSTNMSSELLNNRRDMTNENLRNPTSFRVDVDNGYGQSIFIFGSGRNTATQFEGAAAHDLHERTNKLNISREGISVGCNKVNDSSSLQFSFQSKPETISQYGSLPHPKVQGPCDPVTSLNSSSSFHTFQNGVPDSSFRTMHTGSETAPTEFGAVKQDPSMCSTESLFGLEHIKSSYQDKKGECKSTRKNKRPTRLKHHCKLHQSVSQEAYTNQPDLELPGEFSSMDCSPCPASAEQVSIEAYVPSNESSHTNRGNVSNQNSSCVKDVVSTTEHSVVDGDLPACKDEGRVYNGGAIENNFFICLSRFDGETNICSTSQPCFGNANVGSDGKTRTGTTEVEADSYGYNVDGQIREENTNETAHKFGEPFTFQSSPANFNGLKFTFSLSLSSKSSSSVQRRSSRRKLRMKGGQASQGSATNTSLQPSTSQNANNMQLFPETRKTEDSRKEQAAADASTSAALEMCNTWRTSGNQAFANGHFATAEEYYTRGINFISHHGTSGRCSHSLMLCYSNRAATRMSLGRMREALQDCLFATSIDPSFLKAKVRAGNCQLALGYLEDASKSYAECLKSNSFSCSDHKMLAEASHGLERVKRVADWVSQSKELLKKRTFTDSTLALDLISNALYISSHSDNLMEMKAQALLMLRRYEEVIQLCEETVDLVERNSVLFSGNGELRNDSISDTTECSARLWRLYLICKSYFLLGKLEEALNLLKKHEQLTPAKESHGSMSSECFSSLSATITQLLRLKVAGNESFQAGRYSEAVEQYSAALASNSESRSFSAICFCNRAAAYQALGRVTDAIADCSLAMVLDANYPKAISRRATLYEVIRDYGQAANDLRKLISVLERQVTQSGVSSKCGNKHSDLKQVHGRLSYLEDEARKDTPLNMYLILGVEPSCSATDVKKAYRKAALRHHPDKAAQLLVRNDSADDGFWRGVAKEVHTDADHLFKTIGEAYNVLSDADKRQEYDTEEQLRNDLKRSFKGRNVHKSPEQHYSKQYDRGFSPRWQSNRSASRPRWPGYGYADDFW